MQPFCVLTAEHLRIDTFSSQGTSFQIVAWVNFVFISICFICLFCGPNEHCCCVRVDHVMLY